MSTALDNLKTHYTTLAAALSDTRANLEALAAIESWYGAAVSVERATERGTASYSYNGRSFSFESIAAAREARNAALGDLLAIIGEGEYYIDLSGGRYGPDAGLPA